MEFEDAAWAARLCAVGVEVGARDCAFVGGAEREGWWEGVGVDIVGHFLRSALM